MNPIDFFRTIYMGDSGITSIFLDISNHAVQLQFDSISQNCITGNNNSPNGKLVFKGVDFFSLTPPGFLPDDFIDIEDISYLGDGKYCIVLFSGCYAENNIDNRKIATRNIAGEIITIAGKIRIDIRVKLIFTDAFLN